MAGPSVIVMQRPDRTSDRPSDDGSTAHWQRRPGGALLLKATILLGPLLASLLATRLLHGALDRPLTRTGHVVMWGVLIITGFIVATYAERWARRFLPITMLMRLTLAFPDQAPSRYRLMRAAASPARLREIADSGSVASAAATQVLGLVAELAQHDRHTRGHSERVRIFADLIADELGVTGLDRDKLRWSALIHDVGKLDVPAPILNKNGRPTEAEWAVLQQHPAAGEQRSGALYTWLGEWAGGITEHHERWDGAGYPARLTGDGITLAGRIVAVADAYETMTASRSYKKPMATAAARKELADCAGTQFDPLVVRAFLEVSLPRMMWRVGPLSFLTHLPFVSSIQSATHAALATAGAAAVPTIVAGLSAATVMTGALPSAAVPFQSDSGKASVNTPLPAPGGATPARSSAPGDRPVDEAAVSPPAAPGSATAPTRRFDAPSEPSGSAATDRTDVQVPVPTRPVLPAATNDDAGAPANGTEGGTGTRPRTVPEPVTESGPSSGPGPSTRVETVPGSGSTPTPPPPAPDPSDDPAPDEQKKDKEKKDKKDKK